jgi:hypothetical protein
MNTGVMKYVGESFDSVTRIGIAPFNKVHSKEALENVPYCFLSIITTFLLTKSYSSDIVTIDQQLTLVPMHPAIWIPITVTLFWCTATLRSGEQKPRMHKRDEWEILMLIRFLHNFNEYASSTLRVPVIVIAINGGGITLESILEGKFLHLKLNISLFM